MNRKGFSIEKRNHTHTNRIDGNYTDEKYKSLKWKLHGLSSTIENTDGRKKNNGF